MPFKRAPEGRRALALPKGHADEGETMQEAAAREVREEAGVEGELIEKLGDVEYWYQRKGRRILKKVTFYLFEYARARSRTTTTRSRRRAGCRWRRPPAS